VVKVSDLTLARTEVVEVLHISASLTSTQDSFFFSVSAKFWCCEWTLFLKSEKRNKFQWCMHLLHSPCQLEFWLLWIISLCYWWKHMIMMTGLQITSMPPLGSWASKGAQVYNISPCRYNMSWQDVHCSHSVTVLVSQGLVIWLSRIYEK